MLQSGARGLHFEPEATFSPLLGLCPPDPADPGVRAGALRPAVFAEKGAGREDGARLQRRGLVLGPDLLPSD